MKSIAAQYIDLNDIHLPTKINVALSIWRLDLGWRLDELTSVDPLLDLLVL